MEQARKLGIKFPRDPQLTLTFNATNIILCTSLLRWYLKNGLEVVQVHSATEWHHAPVLKDFVDGLVAMRVQATKDENEEMQMLAKLNLNSSWGRLAMRVDNRRTIAYCRTADLQKHKTLLLKRAEPLESEYPIDLLELEKDKRAITDKQPGKPKCIMN